MAPPLQRDGGAIAGPGGMTGLPEWFRKLSVPMRVALIVLTAAVVLVLYILAPTWIVASTDGAAKLSTDQWFTAVAAQRQGILLVFGGAIAIVGVWLNYLRQRLGETNSRGDRYAAALTNLTSERVEIRTSAIYLLEQVMIDPGAKSQERSNISDVLCTFIRERSTPLHDQFDQVARAESDIRAAALVLARRPRGFDYPPVDLTKADLSGLDLSGADFRGGQLRNTKFVECRLVGACFAGADMLDSQLMRAHLEGADLTRIEGHAIDFTNAFLTGADLSAANVSSGIFRHAILPAAVLDGVDANYATFEGAELEGAHGIRANFMAVNFNGTRNMDRAKFEGSIFNTPH